MLGLAGPVEHAICGTVVSGSRRGITRVVLTREVSILTSLVRLLGLPKEVERPAPSRVVRQQQ